MAERVHIACPGCGTPRMPNAFGLTLDGDEITVGDSPDHEPAVVVQTIGGRGRCRWDRRAISREAVAALYDHFQKTAERLRRILNDEDGADVAV